jgi:NitT/TauT family transport system permease protein
MTTTPTAVQPLPRGGMSRLVGRGVTDWLPAVLVFAVTIGFWEGLIRVFDVQEFLLPKPSAIATTFWDTRGELWSEGWFTFQEAFWGFVLGSGFAILVALVLARWRAVGAAFMPYAIAASAIPIIAFAPITNAWFGLLSPWSKVTIAAVLCFFPVLVNTLRGLTSVDPESIELMRSYAAPEREVFRRVRIPSSLPYVFSALKVASVLAMIGAVVGDYFGGSLEALGIVVLSAVNLSRYATSWAAILVASIMGIAFYATIAGIERYALSWHPSVKRRGS